MDSFINDNSMLQTSKTDIGDMQFFQSQSYIRASTAPSRPLTLIQEFKLSKRFLQLEQAVICSNQLLHKSFEKFDLDETHGGQQICQKFLNYIENLCESYDVKTASRNYRSNFSQAYKVLYKQGKLSYLTQILDSAQQGFPYLWVNGQKYSFSQQVLDYGSKLMIQFFKFEHCLKDSYGKITQQSGTVTIETLITDIQANLEELDASWSTFQKYYVMQLMGIEVQARSLISKAIEAEKCLTSVEIREKMRGKILINCEDYLSTRSQLCQIICQINQTANYCGKGRDDLDHSILCQTEGILRRISRNQSKAIRILGEKIRSTFTNFRTLLRKYDNNIQMVDPQLKNNGQLVQTLVQYEKFWQKGCNYFCDTEKKRFLIHFSGIIEGISEKYEKFQQMADNCDSDIFLIIPCILMLKSLDKDDKNLCKYFLPNLNQIDTKLFRSYFQLEKNFEEWKKKASEHYLYYNILEKKIIEVPLIKSEQNKADQNEPLISKIISKIRNIGNQLHRYNPSEWNSFMEICLAGIIGS